MMEMSNKNNLDDHLHLCSKECAEAEKQDRSDISAVVDRCFVRGACMQTEGSCSDKVPFCR
jgi:hypothetical protein